MLVETTIITLALYLSGCSNLNTKGKLIQAKSTSCKPEGPIGEALEEAIKKASVAAPVAAAPVASEEALKEEKKDDKKSAEDEKKADDSAAAGLGALFG